MARRKKRPAPNAPSPSVTVWPLTLASGRPVPASLSGSDAVFLRRGSIRMEEIASLLGPRLLWDCTATLDELDDNLHWVLSKPGTDVSVLLDACLLDDDRLQYRASTGRMHTVSVIPVRVQRPRPPRALRSLKGVRALIDKLTTTDDSPSKPAPKPQTWRLATPAPAPKKKRKASLWVRFVSVPTGGLNRWRRR